MAEWKKLAIALTLADGKIDDEEVKILKKALWADGKIDEEEVKFLIELRNAAQKKAKARKEELSASFERLFPNVQFLVHENRLGVDRRSHVGESSADVDGDLDTHRRSFTGEPAAVGAQPTMDETLPIGLYSQFTKKKSLFLIIGPPTCPPKRLLS